jgi:calcineurin-like phosphoesterase
VAKNQVYLQGVVIDIDEATGKGRSITRIREPLPGT